MRVRDRRKVNLRDHDRLRAARSVNRQLSRVLRIPQRLEIGRVVWAHVPYRDIEGDKLRPAVVAAASTNEVRVWRVTSSPTRLRYRHHLEIDDLETPGLDRPCAIDLRDPMPVDRIDIVSVGGSLSDLDFLRVQVGVCLWAFESGAAIAPG